MPGAISDDVQQPLIRRQVVKVISGDDMPGVPGRVGRLQAEGLG
jgi:hypothetical protein